MGLDVHLHTYFAVEAPLSVFFTDTGKRDPVCSRNESHSVNPSARFCEHCGAQVRVKATMEPTEHFRIFCEKAGVDPETAFQELRDEGWQWSNNEGTTYSIGWHYAAPMATSEDYGNDNNRILGIKLGDVASYKMEEAGNEMAYSAQDFARFSEIIHELMAEFNISGTPKLYVQAYLSC